MSEQELIEKAARGENFNFNVTGEYISVFVDGVLEGTVNYISLTKGNFESKLLELEQRIVNRKKQLNVEVMREREFKEQQRKAERDEFLRIAAQFAAGILVNDKVEFPVVSCDLSDDAIKLAKELIAAVNAEFKGE